MAIYVSGQPCVICGHSITADDQRVLFPPFTTNDRDPMLRFSDAIVHQSCLVKYPDLERLKRRVADFDQARTNRRKECSVCSKAIVNPDDFFTLGYLGDDETVKNWNYATFHVGCLPLWAGLQSAIYWTESAVAAGVWSRTGIQWLSEQLSSAAASAAASSETA